MYKKRKSAKLKNEALKRWCLSIIINAIDYLLEVVMLSLFSMNFNLASKSDWVFF